MTVAWQDIAFQLEPEMSAEVAEAWAWLVPGPWTPFVCSMVGGIFLETPSGEVRWLETGTALVERVAASREAFEAMIGSSPELVEEWFLPGLVERLHAAGKRAGAGQCYAFTILPVFAGGLYEEANMFVVPVREQFVGMAGPQKQISELPEGAQVRIEIVD